MSTVLPVPASPSLAADRKFFTGAAILSALIVALGFSPTFYLRPATLQPLNTLLVVHGIVLTAWFVLFIVQTSLIAADRRDIHRKLGALGIAIALTIPVIGMMAAIDSLRAGHAPVEGLDPRSFFALPVQVLLNFAIFAGCAIAMRRDAKAHKRLMILASFAMLGPALARIPMIGAYGPPGFFAIMDVLVIAALVYDKRVHGHVHKALKYGAIWFVLSQPIFLGLSQTPPWLAFAGLFL